jgi:hypothetical protein
MSESEPEADLTDEESDEQNDAVIGRAFRISMVVLAIAASAGGAVFWLKHRPDEIIVDEPLPPKTYTVRDKAIDLPSIRFTEVTDQSGIDFVHESGAAGEKLLPESMGGGVVVIDFDSDGDLDIVFVNGKRWPWEIAKDETPRDPATMSAWRNDGNWKFTDVTKEVGLDLSFYGMGAAVGDYDADGDPDLFLTAVGSNHLLRNDDGRFVDVTAEASTDPTAGVGGSAETWSTSAGFLDYDNDGDLDLFVANYVEWNREFDLAQPFQLVGDERAYGRPSAFGGTLPYLYQNDGHGKFTHVSEASGVQVRNPATKVPVAKSLGVTFCDFDEDGWLDIIVSNDTVQNFLFHNEADGTFEEVGGGVGIAFDEDGRARGAMGIDAGWFRNDGSIGIAVGNFATEMTALYVSPPVVMQFHDDAVPTGLGPFTRLELTFGVCWADFDLDGRPDLLAANGHLENEINRVQESQHYEQPPQIFWNCGPDSTTEFVPLTKKECGGDFFKRMVGRGAVVADFDLDGDPDILIGACGQKPRLLRNDQASGHNWIRLEVDAPIGSTVEVHAGGIIQKQQIMPTRSYLSQCDPGLAFGLGSTSSIDRVIVRRPGADQDPVEHSKIEINRNHAL